MLLNFVEWKLHRVSVTMHKIQQYELFFFFFSYYPTMIYFIIYSVNYFLLKGSSCRLMGKMLVFQAESPGSTLVVRITVFLPLPWFGSHAKLLVQDVSGSTIFAFEDEESSVLIGCCLNIIYFYHSQQTLHAKSPLLVQATTKLSLLSCTRCTWHGVICRIRMELRMIIIIS